MIYGIFGYIKLKTMSYLILIEEAKFIGNIINGSVFRVEKLKFVPISTSENLEPDTDYD